MRRLQFAVCGLLVSAGLLMVGCRSKEEYTPYTPGEQTESDHGHHDHAHGPNGGHLIELGEHEYHAELVFDPQSRNLTIYILGGDAQTALPIEQQQLTLELTIGEETVPVVLTAAPLEGEPEGRSSRFEVAGEALPEQIKQEADVDGHLHVTVEGKEYEGHIHHDHDHDHGHH